MIITIAGKAGSGKSTVTKRLANELRLKRYSVGDFRRRKAKEMGLSLAEFNSLGEREGFTDKEADEWQKNIGMAEDNFIIDGRLSYHFIPNSIKIFLDVSPKVGSRRIMREKRDEEEMKHEEEAIRMWKERTNSDIIRYKKYYNLNPYYPKNFDFVLDTTNLSVDEMVKKVLNFVRNTKTKQKL